MAYKLSNTELEIEKEMFEAFKEEEIEDEGEVGDDDMENEAVAQEIHELMEKITSRYKFVDRVNPGNEYVQKLVAIAGYSSWGQFQKDRREYVLEYMDLSAASEPIRAILNEPEIKDSWKKKQLEQKLIVIQRKIKELQAAKENQAKQLYDLTIARHRLNVQLKPLEKKARLSSVVRDQITAIKEEMQEVKEAAIELRKIDYSKELIELRHQEVEWAANLRFLQNAAIGRFACYVNTSDSKWNCNRYDSIADDVAFEFVFSLNDEEKWMEQLASERYAPQDSERLNAKEMNETESYPLKRLKECRDRMGLIHEFFAELAYGYAINEENFMSNNDGASPIPNFRRKNPPRPQRWLTLEERAGYIINKRQGGAEFGAPLDYDAFFEIPV